MSVTIPTIGAVNYEPVNAAYVTAGGTHVPETRRLPEKAGKTFKQGVPLVFNGGYVEEATFGSAQLVIGFSQEPGHNLASDGVSNDAVVNHGAARNMPSSKIIPVGAWFSDGRCGVYIANSLTVFSIALKAGQVFTQAMVGGTYGLVKDNTSGFWYLDNEDTSGDNAVAEVIGVDSSAPNTASGGARVFFRIIPSKRASN
jgi:hypothetical protein